MIVPIIVFVADHHVKANRSGVLLKVHNFDHPAYSQTALPSIMVFHHSNDHFEWTEGIT